MVGPHPCCSPARLGPPAQVPPSRWDVDHGWFDPGTTPKRFGSFVEGAELFDPAFFMISTQEVAGWSCHC